MLKSGLIAVVAAVLVFLTLPAYAGETSGCCLCGTGDFTPCPSGNAICFTGTDNCEAKCEARGCDASFSNASVPCGEAEFEDCGVIDPSLLQAAPLLSFPALALLLLTLGAITFQRMRRVR